MYYRTMKIIEKSVIAIVTCCLLGVASCASNQVSNIEQDASPAEHEKDDEYARSTLDVQVSLEEFRADKSEILKIIDELFDIMATYDYNSWLNYIEPDSKNYWSSPENLYKASKRLPNRNQKLSTLSDYFRFVFVPSRKGRKVGEIRYISRDVVKAVQVREEQDVVYYHFVKIDGKWLVRIPALQS